MLGVKIRVALIGAGLLLALGCQQAPGPGVWQGAPTTGSLTLRLKQEGDAALARGDYEAAALKLQQAVNQEPADMSLRYALGTALSHLNRREDAAREFTWVVERGVAGSQEMEIARRWLVSAGYRVEGAETAVAATTPNPPVAPGSYTPKNRVKGKMEWPGVTPPETMIPVHVTLVGEGSGNREFNKTRRFRLGKVYEFWDVPAGKYQLVAQAGDTLLWEQQITVEADKDTQLDLSAANSRVSPQEFPGSRKFE